MNLRWIGLEQGESPRSLVRDLCTGHGGWLFRIGMSLALAAMLAAVAMVLLGLSEAWAGGIEDEAVAVGVGVAAAIWCGLLVPIWGNVPRGRRIIRAFLLVLGTWAIVMPATLAIDEALRGRGDLLLAAAVLLGIALTFLFVALAFRQSRGPSVSIPEIRCAACGYHLQGLRSCQCPECGRSYTLEEIVAMTLTPEMVPADRLVEGAAEPDAPLAIELTGPTSLS
jgi:hypothetical protein